jgi:hypothetical protein
MSDALAARSLNLGEGVAESARKWWLLERSARSLDLFRIVVATILAAHFTMHFVQTAPLLAYPGIVGSTPLDAGGWARTSWLQDLPLWSIRAVFAFAGGAALAIAAGVAPRVAAGLVHLVAVSTYWAVSPFAGIDDFVVNLASLVLVLMPIGRTRRPWQARRAENAAERVPALSVSMWLVGASFLYLDRGLGALFPDDANAHVLAIVAAAIPIAYVLPAKSLRSVGVLLQLGLHAWLAFTTKLFVANAILAATAILFWGEIPARRARPWVLDAGSAATSGLVLMGVIAFAGMRLEPGRSPIPAVRVLADLGALPALTPPVRDTASLQVKTLHGTVVVEGSGRIWNNLKAAISNEGQRETTRFRLARRFCGEQTHWGQSGTLGLAAGGQLKKIADFECGKGGSLHSLR